MVAMVERVLVGAIAGAHGVRGQLRIKSFTDDPAAVAAYGPVSDESGQRTFELIVTGKSKDGVIARIDGIADRTAAEALRGVRLYVQRDALPPPKPDEYYRVDLIGLTVERADGSVYGRITNVEDYGAGDILEVELPDGATELLLFTDRIVPTVDLAARRVVIDPPAYVEARANGGREDG
jgi:16S rRNA processing protein RimM